MKISKLLIGCLLAFLLPVAVAVILVPDVFFSTSSRNNSKDNSLKDNSAALSQTSAKEQSSEGTDNLELNVKSFVEVASSEDLDPKIDTLFFVSVKFGFSKLPSEGESIRFLTKYQEGKWPYPGWGLKIKRQTGSIRPEVYWMGTNGRGGWYSFGEIDLKENHWSTLTLIVDRGKSISLYYQDLINEADTTGIALPKFVGGFTVSEVPIPKNEGALKLLIPVSSKISEPCSIHDLLVGRIGQSEGAMLKFVNGGPAEMAQRLKTENIGLWIDARGRDRSSFARKLIRTH